ncbi:MAG: ATP-binding protein, partial [Rhizobiaceae bacterium]
MTTNTLVRNQLLIFAGPAICVIGLIVLIGANYLIEVETLTTVLGAIACLLFGLFPLAIKRPNLVDSFAVAALAVTCLTLASKGYLKTGLLDGGLFMICILPFMAGFFIGRKIATATLAAVFLYIAYCLYKYSAFPSAFEAMENWGEMITRAMLLVLPMMTGYIIAIVFSGKSHAYSQALLALNESLETATSKALDADRAKSEFLANMSHEIRTPMNGVIGMAELLNKTELTQKQRLFSDTILKSGVSLLTIINDILDFSKIEAGQLTLDPAPFDLRELIDDVAAIVAPRIGTKNVELIVRVAPNTPAALEGDAGRIRQVLINLMGNAVKFTDVGHVFVDVSSQPTIGRPGTVATLCVRIEDTGIGMKPDECERIFGKFSQADSSSTRKHEGTGLGLSIATSLVALMDGDITVTSEFGKGSVFSVTMKMPITKVQAAAPVMPILTKQARVLIVDDNAVNRSILTEQMSAWNFDSAAVSSGPEALEFLTKAHSFNISIDLIILDYQMPGMNGKHVLAQLRADPRTSGIAVLLLTSIDAAQNDKDLIALGLQGSLTKPARASVLYDTIVQILSVAEFA